MSPEEAAERGAYERMTGDAALAALLGSGVRVFPTWPPDTLSQSDFPRVTFYAFGPAPRRPGFQRVRLTLDLWAWSTEAVSGRPKILSLDARVLELFDEQSWTYDSHRLYSVAGGFRDSPGATNGRMRRTRELTLEVSPLA